MTDDAVPVDFGWRYVAWYLWCNAITILMLAQAIVGVLMLDPAVAADARFHWLVIANAVLCAVIAQVKRNNPPGPAPTKVTPNVN